MRLLGLDTPALVLTLLVACGLVLWLYLQKRPPTRVVVPSLLLWESLAPDLERAVAPWRRTPEASSLLLALAIALALIAALADPLRSATGPARSVLIAIDHSASMAARDVAPSRLAEAKRQARARLDTLPADATIAVVAVEVGAVPLTSFTTDRAVLLRAIDGIRDGNSVGDLLPLSELALDLSRPRPGAELVLFSDGNLEHGDQARRALDAEPALSAQHVLVGQSARNVGFSGFSLRRYPLDPTHQECLVSLTNFGAQRERLSLRVFAAGGLLSEESFALEPGQTVARTLRDLPSSGARLTAKLTLHAGPDTLASDDLASAALPPRPRTRVLAVSRDDRYLTAALLLDESLTVRELDPAAYESADGFDVVVFDGVLPSAPVNVAALYLGPHGQGAHPLPLGTAVERPFFERVDKRNALLSGLALTDVNVARAALLLPRPGDLVLAEGELKSGTRVPLLVEGKRNGTPFLTLAFDPRESDLPLRAAFPLFLLRALDHLAHPDGARAALAEGVVASEGAIAPHPDVLGKRESSRAAVAKVGASQRWWPILLALAIGLLTLEWFTFQRRWTT
ncbi:MAG: hypothetical protein RLZZ450_6760 [Pseudomonadota bacterium]|jgi:hypothetical protein